MIRNIIFDMGNVLLRFDKDLFIQRLGVSPEDGKILMVEVFCSLEWSRMDRGSMTEAQAAAKGVERCRALAAAYAALAAEFLKKNS